MLKIRAATFETKLNPRGQHVMKIFNAMKDRSENRVSTRKFNLIKKNVYLCTVRFVLVKREAILRHENAKHNGNTKDLCSIKRMMSDFCVFYLK